MNYDRDKVDEMTLALLYLVTSERQKGFGARAWKGYDWGTLKRLHEKGWIADPASKATSFHITEEGAGKSEKLFLKHFGQGEKSFT